MKKLSIVIPLFNAQNILSTSVCNLNEELKTLSIDYEILLRDDGSEDQSLDLIKSLSKQYQFVKGYFNERNCGLGTTLKKLFAEATGDVVIYVDIDLPFGVNIIKDLIDHMRNADIVIASRYKGRPNHVKFFRKLLSRGYFCLCYLLFGSVVNDIGSGSVAFRKEMLDEIEIISKGFGVHIELLLFAYQKGLRVVEIGAESNCHCLGSFRVLKHGFSVIKETMFLWKKHIGIA